MTSRSPSALRKSTAPGKSAIKTSAVTAKSGNKTGKLPEWNLADLYSGIDAPEVTRDLQKMDAECVAFETDYKASSPNTPRARVAANGWPKRSGAMRRSRISPGGSDRMPA